jgi:hypothetical protein
MTAASAGAPLMSPSGVPRTAGCRVPSQAHRRGRCGGRCEQRARRASAGVPPSPMCQADSAHQKPTIARNSSTVMGTPKRPGRLNSAGVAAAGGATTQGEHARRAPRGACVPPPAMPPRPTQAVRPSPPASKRADARAHTSARAGPHPACASGGASAWCAARRRRVGSRRWYRPVGSAAIAMRDGGP